MLEPPQGSLTADGFGVMRPWWVVLISESGNRARPINTLLTTEEAPACGDHTLSCCKPRMCPKHKKKRELKATPKSLTVTALLGAAEAEKNNNNPAWFNLQDWSVPVNITEHAGRVRALLSACLLHADTIRIAVCVPESHHLLSNTHIGESRTERCDWGRPRPLGH